MTRNTSQDVWEMESLLSLVQGEIEARRISEKIKAATEQVKGQYPSRHPFPTAATVMVLLQTQSQQFQNVFTALKDISLHLVTRISENAYATVVFLRSCFEDGCIWVRLLASKSKAASMTGNPFPVWNC